MRNIILALIVSLIGIITPLKSFATVSNGTNQVIYNGDGVTSTFSFSFNVYNSASENDLLVSELNTTTGAVTNLNLNTDYTVSLTHATPSPGTLTLTAGALAIGTNLSILRQLPLTQNVTEADNSATPAAVRNNVYDRTIMITQQLQQQLTRAILQNIFATTSITLPAAVANYGLCWDTTATFLTNCAQLTGTIGVPIANSNLQTLTQSNLVNGSSLFGSASLTSLTTTGNVGIGSSSPGQILDIQGTVRFTNVGSGNGFIVQDQASDTTPFVIDGNGNVGIGSSTPGIVLDVNGSVRATSFTGQGNTGIATADPATRALTTIYGPSSSDGFASASCIDGGSSLTNLHGFMNTNSTPSGGTDLCNVSMTATTSGLTCSFYVRKGYYYEWTVNNCSGGSQSFTAIGS